MVTGQGHCGRRQHASVASHLTEKWPDFVDFPCVSALSRATKATTVLGCGVAVGHACGKFRAGPILCGMQHCCSQSQSRQQLDFYQNGRSYGTLWFKIVRWIYWIVRWIYCNFCCMLWVNKLLTYSSKIHNSNFWATAIQFQVFITLSFRHVLTRNQVCWWNNSFEKLPQKSTPWKFYYVKVMDEFPLLVYIM